MYSSLNSAPTTSPHLDTLDVVSVGISLDVYRQGQVWAQMRKQDAAELNSLHVGSILPMDPRQYPVTAGEKDMAWEQRQANALELALKDFREAWPIPTVTVVRGWDRNAPRLRVPVENMEPSLTTMVDDNRPDAGLHWHEIMQLKNGVICNDTPEGTIEMIFRSFEANPDMPAMLVYVVEGFSMANALSSRNTKIGTYPLIGLGTGPRQPGELTDAIVALVVARPERVDWLRYFVPYTAAPADHSIYPGFTFWDHQPPVPFRPTTFIPKPWTALGFKQWDAMKTLAVLHRPVTVSLNDATGARLKNDALTTALANGWKAAAGKLNSSPSRVFYDAGQKPIAPPLAQLMPALKAAGSPLDLLESKESYDLTQRLGDTGAASPFVGIALATMATYLNADTSVVVPLRRADQATLITITSPTPGKKPSSDPFGVKLLPQTASSDAPTTIMQPQQPTVLPPLPTTRPFIARSAEQMLREQRMLDDFIAGGDGSDPVDRG